MTEKTFRKMTKKRPVRRQIALLRRKVRKYLNKDWLFNLLAKMHLVRKIDNIEGVFMHKDGLAKITACPRIVTDRAKYDVTYYAMATEIIKHLWYESRIFKKNGKPLRYHTVFDGSYAIDISVTIRAECAEFEIRKSIKEEPFVVNRSVRRICVLDPYEIHKPSGDMPISQSSLKYNYRDIDLSKVRMGTTLKKRFAKEPFSQDLVDSVVQEACALLRNEIERSAEEINYRLIGIENDGEPTTERDERLIHGYICQRCGLPVFKSKASPHGEIRCLICGYQDRKEMMPVGEEYDYILKEQADTLYKLLSRNRP